ncbi:hypothetical protein [Streptomyces zingiberis]|nr:hypothetical protein [Streptomyces zingiberis]
MAAGAEELEARLLDTVRGGLAGAGRGAWEETAARMIDAQAPGLEARVRELAAVAAAGGDPGRLLEECALLHLLNRALLGLPGLPEPLAATVRTRAGVPVRAAEVLATGERVRDRWLVLARRETTEGALTARRIWLRGTDTGRMALLLVFGAPGRPLPETDLPVGHALDAEVAFHPGARPLRVVLGECFSAPEVAPPPPGSGTGRALAAYGSALRADPWLAAWPAVLAGVVPIPPAAGPGPRPAEDGNGWQLADGDGRGALPVDPRAPERPGLWRLLAVSGGAPVTVSGECGHRGFLPHTAWSPETGEAIPL